MTKGPLRILAQVAGPQQSYRAEMYGAAIGAAIASDGYTPCIDNMAVTKCAYRRPTHKCSGVDIRHKVCDQVQHTRRYGVDRASHRVELEARNAQEREQIRRNGEVDVLAKMAEHLPMPDYDPQHPEDIAICGGPTPTPALRRKWILHRRRVATFGGPHWVSWLPMRRDQRMLWVKWLWGQVRWDGTGTPWDHTTPKCPLCPLHHSNTVHKRLIHCMRWKVAFRNMYLSTWGAWQDTVSEWWNGASAADLHCVSYLRIRRSLWDYIPLAMRVDLRECVAWHQYHALHGVWRIRMGLRKLCGAGLKQGTGSTSVEGTGSTSVQTPPKTLRRMYPQGNDKVSPEESCGGFLGAPMQRTGGEDGIGY